MQEHQNPRIMTRGIGGCGSCPTFLSVFHPCFIRGQEMFFSVPLQMPLAFRSNFQLGPMLQRRNNDAAVPCERQDREAFRTTTIRLPRSIVIRPPDRADATGPGAIGRLGRRSGASSSPPQSERLNQGSDREPEERRKSQALNPQRTGCLGALWKLEERATHLIYSIQAVWAHSGFTTQDSRKVC